MGRRTKVFAHQAFTLTSLLILIAILALLAALLLPALARARTRAHEVRCENNLKSVSLAFRIWAADNNDRFPMSVSTNARGSREWVDGGNAFRHLAVLSNELNTPKVLVCPAEGSTEARDFSEFSNANLSYFVGLDVQEHRHPMLLLGDRNITNGLVPRRTILHLPPDQPAGWTEAVHRATGHIALADGSVYRTTTTELRSRLRNTGDPTNRVALPD